MPYSHQLVLSRFAHQGGLASTSFSEAGPSIESPKEYRRINKASVELETSSQLTSPVVAEFTQAVEVIASPREFRRVRRASVVLVTEELSTNTKIQTATRVFYYFQLFPCHPIPNKHY